MSTATIPQPSTRVERPRFKDRYDHFINGRWTAPSGGAYFENISPIDGKPFTLAARGNAADIERAIDAAQAAFPAWSKTAAATRSNLLLKIAQVVEDNLEYLARVETIDNGKAIRETRAADIPLVVDHFRHRGVAARLDASAAAETETTTTDMDEELFRAICTCVNDLIPTLKAENAVLVQRVELGGEPLHRVADDLGITPNNASVRLHRARRTLRDALQDTCGACADHGCLDCGCRRTAHP